MTTQELTLKQKQEAEDRERTRPGRYFIPDVDIYEDEQGLCLWADMPGVAQDGVTVELDDETLTLQGDVAVAEYEGLAPVRTEYNVGPFSRRFTLPRKGGFDREKIRAQMRDGVLEVVIPKAEKAKPRRITVNATS